MTTGRPIKEQLSTARYILAQFIAQIEEFENMNREQRRTERGRDLTARIDGLTARIDGLTARIDGLTARIDGLTARIDGLTARIDGLRTGRTTWEQRITDLQNEHDQETP